MRKIVFFIILLFSSFNLFAKLQKDPFLKTLYQLIDTKDTYMVEKEQRIEEIRKMLTMPDINDRQRYDINLQLYNEYKTYISDSAIYYARENSEIATRLNDHIRMNESRLDLTSLYIVAGMYIESINLLQSIQPKELPDWLQVKYYNNQKQLYNHYSYNNLYTSIYSTESSLYRDSLLQVLDPLSNHYQIVYAEKLYDGNKLTEARQILKNLLNKSESEDHERAVLAYALANVYKKEGDIHLQKKYYAISAICDIKNAIKENASMQALASLLYETGDIKYAYKCIKSSMEDAMFCNARLRTFEVSRIFPIIDSAYQGNAAKQKSELQFFLITVSILSLFLIMAVIYVYRQMKKVAGIRKQLYETNLKLNELNKELQKANTQLQRVNQRLSEVNTDLSEANQIKETYIGHFLDLCSRYIDKLENYQKTLHKKAVERKLDELYKMLKSSGMIENELKELFENFDHIFLHLYPNFVDNFNSLLYEDERFTLKPNELLNTELRIFALIRLGITDSSKIASFLHYSANTIYSYRTRVRNKAAVPREEFESLVKKIGTIKKI